MTKQQIKLFVLTTAATAALGATAQAQSADAIIDKLVEKGVLTTKEAQDLRDEADKNFTTAYAAKSGMSDWVQALKFNGDIRGRYENFDYSNNVGGNSSAVDRHRLRYRMRFGVVAQMMDNFEAGFKLTSDEANGSFGGDPISGNTTFQDNASKKLIYIDQAYGKWSPLKGPDFTGSFTIGKMENPFVFSDMVFDPDYTPEGVAAQLGYIINNQHTLKLNSGYFVLDEYKEINSDPYLVGAQLRLDSAWNSKFNTSLGASYLAIANQNFLTNGALPNVQRGNSRNDKGAPLYQYTPLVLDAAATYTLESFPMYAGAFPIKVMGDYIYNNGAPSNGNDRSDNTGRPVDNYGYSAGIQFGKSGKKGTWDLSYTYKWLGANAWWEELTDSDFGALYAGSDSPRNSGSNIGYGSGTNVKGHVVKFSYSPSDAWTFSMKWFLTQLINEYPVSGVGAESKTSRLQVDANWKF